METHEILTNTLPIIHEVYFDGNNNFGLGCPSYGMNIIESRSIHLAPLILADTPYGIVSYFNNPDPDAVSRLEIGASILDVPTMISASLSTNSDQIVFKVGYEPQIGTIDLQTQQIELYDLLHIPEALVSDGERYIYYSVRIEGDELLIPNEYWENDQFWYLACDEHINQVAIYKFDTETGVETLIYPDIYHSIPWMTLSPNGQELYYSAIPNGEIWRDAMVEDNCVSQECMEYLFPSLYRLNLNSLQSDLILEDVLKPIINFGYQSQN